MSTKTLLEVATVAVFLNCDRQGIAGLIVAARDGWGGRTATSQSKGQGGQGQNGQSTFDLEIFGV